MSVTSSRYRFSFLIVLQFFYCQYGEYSGTSKVFSFSNSLPLNMLVFLLVLLREFIIIPFHCTSSYLELKEFNALLLKLKFYNFKHFQTKNQEQFLHTKETRTRSQRSPCLNRGRYVFIVVMIVIQQTFMIKTLH